MRTWTSRVVCRTFGQFTLRSVQPHLGTSSSTFTLSLVVLLWYSCPYFSPNLLAVSLIARRTAHPVISLVSRLVM